MEAEVEFKNAVSILKDLERQLGALGDEEIEKVCNNSSNKRKRAFFTTVLCFKNYYFFQFVGAN